MPVIATNWSGQTEFINEENSFPIRIEGLEPMNRFSPDQWAKVGEYIINDMNNNPLSSTFNYLLI